MAKFWAKASPITKLMIGVFIIGLVYVFMGGDESPKRTTKKVPVKRSASSSVDQYTEADRTAKFAIYSQSARDTFKPLIARANPRGEGGVGSTKENAIPAYLAGGDANWTYTGTAEVNGVPSALFENSTTADGVFLKQGEHWKDLVIELISQDSVVVKSSGGDTVILRLASPVSEEEVKPLAVNQSPLQGAIGTVPGMPQMGMAQDAPTMGNISLAPAAAADAAPAGGNGGGRRGGRRGRNQNSGDGG